MYSCPFVDFLSLFLKLRSYSFSFVDSFMIEFTQSKKLNLYNKLRPTNEILLCYILGFLFVIILFILVLLVYFLYKSTTLNFTLFLISFTSLASIKSIHSI